MFQHFAPVIAGATAGAIMLAALIAVLIFVRMRRPAPPPAVESLAAIGAAGSGAAAAAKPPAPIAATYAPPVNSAAGAAAAGGAAAGAASAPVLPPGGGDISPAAAAVAASGAVVAVGAAGGATGAAAGNSASGTSAASSGAPATSDRSVEPVAADSAPIGHQATFSAFPATFWDGFHRSSFLTATTASGAGSTAAGSEFGWGGEMARADTYAGREGPVVLLGRVPQRVETVRSVMRGPIESRFDDLAGVTPEPPVERGGAGGDVVVEMEPFERPGAGLGMGREHLKRVRTVFDGVSVVVPNGAATKKNHLQVLPLKASLVQRWSQVDVARWLNQSGFPPSVASAFIAARVDGQTLLTLDDESLRTFIGLHDAAVRAAILRAIADAQPSFMMSF
ncbi:hypothetical protein HDU96_007429 [Phlyctochytrium bullatum]|nr:hypothetical protein HDU96_007429 [Phlyctochytrium bullatum]